MTRNESPTILRPVRQREFVFSTLPLESELCPRCGHASPAAMRRSFWSRHPHHRRDELAAKSAIVVLVLVTGIAIVWWVGRGPSTGPGAGWLVVLPAALGVALWSNAEKFTRHRANFRPSVFWGALGLGASGILAANDSWVLAGLAAAITGVVLMMCRAARQWKAELIAGDREP